MLNSILMQFKFPDAEVHQVFFMFNQMFEPILGLNKNDKIGMVDIDLPDDNSFKVFIKLSEIKWALYLDKSSYAQSVKRWWYEQNRKDIFDNLTTMFNVYTNYLKYVYTQFTYTKFLDLKPKILDFNQKLILGLDNLKLTYKNDETIVNIISTIIESISFK